jgi:nucleoside-diphosphate-sugar epimerase
VSHRRTPSRLLCDAAVLDAATNKEDVMRVFVAGATGAVGRRLVSQLIKADHEVVGATRSESKRQELWSLGAEPVVVDALDATAVGEAVAKAAPDVVVHQLTALAGTKSLRNFDRAFAATNALRTVGTDNLLAAARACGVRRFIAASYTGWPYARTGGAVKTESDPLDSHPVAQQRVSLAAIKHLEDATLRAPLSGVVLRYGMFYGPGASDEMIAAIRKRMLPIVGDGGGVWSMLHIDDAAGAVVAALDGGEGVYNIVDDDPAPTRELIPALAEIVGAKPPRHVPVWLGRLLAGEAVVSMLTQARGASNAKAKRELHWTPTWPSWRDGFRHGLSDVQKTRG